MSEKETQLTNFKCEYLKILKNLNISFKYSRPNYLEHYEKLSDSMLEQFDSLILAKAAFLHGMSVSNIVNLISEKIFIEQEIIDILREREQLLSIKSSEEDIFHEVISGFNNPDSIILYIWEKIHHIDSNNCIKDFIHNFRSHHPQTLKLPELIISPPDRTTESFLKTQQKFLLVQLTLLFSLWTEKEIVETAQLLSSDFSRAQEILNFASNNYEVLKNFESEVKKQIPQISNNNIFWEFRNIGSINSHIGNKQIALEPFVKGSGFLTIVCSNEKICFQTLHRIHQLFEHAPGEIKDLLSKSANGFYRALHTAIILPYQKRYFVVNVRIIPKEYSTRRFSEQNNVVREKIAGLLQEQEPGLVKVYTSGGKPVSLDRGATVLHFAYRLSNDIVAFLKGAKVNLLEVDLLRKLENGDVIELMIADKADPQELPAHIIEKILDIKRKNKEERNELENDLDLIFDAYKKYFRPALEKQGKRYILKILNDRGINNLIDENLIDEIVEKQSRNLFRKINLSFTPKSYLDWFYLQVGIYYKSSRTSNYYFTNDIDLKYLRNEIENIINIIVNTNKIILRALGSANSFLAIRFCSRCHPRLQGKVIGEEKNNTLILHSIGSTCDVKGNLYNFGNSSPSDFHFVIESINRTGIAKELLSVFETFNIEIVEYIGFRFDLRKAVHRILLDYIDKQEASNIKSKIKDIIGVDKVILPWDLEYSSYEQRYLPPRVTLVEKTPLKSPNPYVYGPPIRNESNFYGRDNELNELLRVTSEISQRKICGGSFFIKGDKRIGKSSLGEQFINIVQGEYPCIAYHSFDISSTWSKVEHIIHREIKKSYKFSGNDSAYSLNEMLDTTTTNSIAPIIILDEVVAGLNLIPDKKEAYFSICNLINHGCVFILIGAFHGLGSLKSQFFDLLVKRSHQINLDGLNKYEVSELLQVSKLRSYSVKYMSAVLKEIYDDTEGNPYYTTILASTMYDLSIPNETGEIIYTLGNYRAAKMNFFTQPYNFLGNDELDKQKWEILYLLSGKKSQSGSDIIKFLKGYDNLKKTQIKQGIIDLYERGLIKIIATFEDMFSSKIEQNNYKISPPILAEYININYSNFKESLK